MTTRRKQLTALAVIVALVVGVVVGLLVFGGGSNANASDVALQPVSSTGANPFMPPVGQDQTGVTSPSTTSTPTTSPTTAAPTVTSYSGDTPGLYGGTRNSASCDPGRMVSYLEANADKAAAWASTLGIPTSDIQSYVATLTPVLLRADTWVTNHGFVNGHADPLQSILQAGTAVLVNQFGLPVAKCFCGNPLAAPVVYAHPKFTGPPWPNFSLPKVVISVKASLTINKFTLVDIKTNKPFTRPAGTKGEKDGNAPGLSTTTTTTTTTTSPTTTATTTTTTSPTTTSPVSTATPPPVTQPQATEPPTTAEDADGRRALDKLSRVGSACYPFKGLQQDVSEKRTTEPGPDPNTLVLKVVGITGSGGTQIFTWNVNRQTMAFTPTSPPAQIANNDCPGLGQPGG